MTPPEPATNLQPAIDLWDFVLPLGGGEPLTAVSRADQVDQLALALTNPQLERRSQEFIREMQKGLVDLDLGKLWGLFPNGSGGQRRTLPVVGRNQGGAGYRLIFFPTRAEPSGYPLGRLDGRLSLEPMKLPVTRRDGYRMDGNGQIGMSGFNSREMAQAGERGLALLEGATRTSLWKAVHEALPQTAPFLEKFVTVDANRTNIRFDPRVGSYLACDLTFRLNVDAFEEPYPDLYDYLDRLGDLFHFSGGIWNDAGQALARFEIDSKTLTLRIRFLAQNGAVLPMLEDGKLADGAGVRLSEVKQDRFVVTLRGRVKKYGTTFHLKNYPFTVSLSSDDSHARFSTAVTKAPRVEVGDRVFLLIPSGVADWFIPGTIAEHTKAFFEALARGPDGKGTRAEGKMINGTAGEESLWRGALHAAVLDNLLVKVTLRMVAENLLPQEEATKDADRFVRELYRRLSADYRSARPRLLTGRFSF